MIQPNWHWWLKSRLKNSSIEHFTNSWKIFYIVRSSPVDRQVLLVSSTSPITQPSHSLKFVSDFSGTRSPSRQLISLSNKEDSGGRPTTSILHPVWPLPSSPTHIKCGCTSTKNWPVCRDVPRRLAFCLHAEFVDIVRPIVTACDFDQICENAV